jgi:hypothetical protein
MFADGAADEVGGGVGGPGDNEGKEEEISTTQGEAVEPDGEGEWKGDKKERARADASSRKGLDERTTSPQSE